MRTKSMDRKIYRFGILEALDQPGVETIVRSHAAVHSMVPRDDVHRCRHRDPGRVSAL